MKASYKMMGVILCGVILLASGCGAKAETSTASVAESVSESASPVESNPVSSESASEDASESEAVSETASEASSVVGEAVSEAPAESKVESKAEPKTKSEPAKTEAAASSKAEKPQPVESKPASEAAPAEQAAPAETASLETALKYVGKDVSKLYAAIGKPTSSEYASSCIGDGEDGLLYYDGFTVTTYRENGKERRYRTPIEHEIRPLAFHRGLNLYMER